jgi:uncharacterized membrane protein
MLDAVALLFVLAVMTLVLIFLLVVSIVIDVYHKRREREAMRQADARDMELWRTRKP